MNRAKRSNYSSGNDFPSFKDVYDPSTNQNLNEVQIPQEGIADGIFEEIHAKHHLHAPPNIDLQDAQKVGAFIQNALQGLTFKFQEAYGGIPLSFDDIHVINNDDSDHIAEDGENEVVLSAVFLNDSPWAHFWVRARWFAFVPKAGHRLSALVVGQSAESISLLAFGLFTVTVAASQAGAMYEWNGHGWQTKKSASSPSKVADIYPGAIVPLEVLDVSGTADGLAIVKGSLDRLFSVMPSPLTLGKGGARIPSKQYGDHLLIKRLLLDGSTARKRLKRVRTNIH